MRKYYLGLALLSTIGWKAQAQLGEGGLPLSMQGQTREQYVPTNQFALPDWESARQKAEEQEKAGMSKPYLVALPVAADISFPASGTLIRQDNGQLIWKTQVSIEKAPALGFNYDQFQLPKGVKLYLSNANGQHIIGAYTEKNNSEDGRFANEPVQGGIVNLEMDIDPGVNTADIKLHIYKVFVYFRSYEYLNQYATDNTTGAKPTDPDPFQLEGSSSICGINAVCPLGANYPQQRKATVQILSNGGACSATMINNTNNTPASCRQYLLTATHCDPENATANSHFTELLIRFNFERQQCMGGPSAQVNTMQGADFKARANYVETPSPEINGDFLLLELRSKVPASWDAYLAGWNRATSMPSPISYPKRYIGFHHPGGDIKKVSTSGAIDPNGEAGGSLGPGTHWQIYPIDSGGVAGGSSGSGLFDGDGRLIGIASVAGDSDGNCETAGNGSHVDFFKYIAYSKLSLDWDYSLDGTAAMRRLQPWLDPNNTGVVTLNAVKSTCATVGIDNTARTNFENAISIYPNPVSNGTVTAKVNFKETTDLTVELYNVAGARQATYSLPKVQNGSYSFNLNGYANGIYLLKFSNGDTFTTKRISLLKQ